MSYIGQGLPADTFQGFVTDSFTGDGSATTFTLSKEPFSEDTLIVVINNVIQKPTTNFTVSGTTLTIVGTAVASGDVIYAIHMGGPLPIGGAAELDLNGASDKLILDADADTTISADTDDRIDFKAGGTDTLHVGNGVVTVGTTTAFGPTGFPTGVKVNGDVLIGDFTNDSIASTLCFIKSRNTTPGSQTIVNNGDEVGSIDFRADDGDDTGYNNNVARIAVAIDAAPGTNDTAGNMTFATTADGARSVSERMRIASTGNVAIGNTDTTPALGITVADTRITSGVCLDVHHTKTDTTFSGILARLQSARNTSDPDDYEFIRCAISGVANKLFVHATGSVDNATGSYGTISDERIKQDITDANSQWDDIKALKFKNFKKKANVRDFGDDALKEIGVIAQDLEAAGMNGLVQEAKPDPSHIYSDSSFGTVWTEDDDEVKNGTETVGEVKEVKAKVKTVKYSILYMKAVKALQEAMARIETLETKVKALEDA
jgi:hypothetical protein